MKSESRSAVGKLMLGFAVALALVAVPTPQARALTFSVVHNFTGGNDGANPLSGFTIDGAGNLYGTTNAGGVSGWGTVFKMTQSGSVIVLYSFTGGIDGGNPGASLLLDAATGYLYGTTNAGGAFGVGTVFKVSPYGGKQNVLYSFTGGTDGASPEAGLAIDAAGFLYGTTTAGGAHGYGTVFRLGLHQPPGSAYKVLYSFGVGTDGEVPVAGVTLDASGNLYGTTSAGGTYGYGTVFQLTPPLTPPRPSDLSSWTERILHNFQYADDGAVPYAGLIFDQSGNLYGAATEGGAGTNGGGTIFKLTRSQSGWTFTVLYRLPGSGISGTFRNLIMDASGRLYGTTHCDGANNAGTVYKLTYLGSTWIYDSLHVFTGGSDGLYSFSNLVFDANGNLYGSTDLGGANGSGVVFKIIP
jgi:uncharacterized repeat protein (TIGR03803 family)